jgi:two-component system response regulator WspF
MRIGIVNDMVLAREALKRVVLAIPGHQIAWTACDGAEALERSLEDRPDLILMDLFMPRMDGAEATRRIMAECPCPIVVVTATVSGHLSKVYEAMGHGALDAVDTPTLGHSGEITGSAALKNKIDTIAKLTGNVPGLVPRPDGAGPIRHEPAHAATAAARPSATPSPLVLLGASTGGPNALAVILAGLPRDWDAGVLIVQHVDAEFAPGLASWLSERSGQTVELVTEGDGPDPGRRLLAATNDHLILSADRRLHYVREPRDLSYRPSVDLLFNSVADHWPHPGVAALLTGMGKDGAAGLLRLRRRKWRTIAQDEASSIVYGMPRAAVEIHAAAAVLPVTSIADAILASVPARPPWHV